jgi:hypothetical protein
MNWLANVALISVAVLIVWHVQVSNKTLDSLQQIKTLLEQRLRRPYHHPHAGLTNYSTWTYRDGIWEIVETRVEYGFVPGDPPRRPGAYEGETVRRPAVRGQ